MKPWAKDFYSSAAWKSIRAYVMKRDHYLCQDCLKKNIVTPAEEVHHTIVLTPSTINDPSISLNPDLLVSLCRFCHQQRHSDRPAKRYHVDAFGHVTMMD